jgi:hypothetical protein
MLLTRRLARTLSDIPQMAGLSDRILGQNGTCDRSEEAQARR